MESIEHTLHKIKAVTMTTAEKSALRTHLVQLTNQPIVKPTPSPYHALLHPFIVSFASLVFVFLGGASISYGAGNALPGDRLYSFKINVNEKVAGIFIKSDTEKLIYESKLLKNRITEMKTMQESGTLTAENTAILSKAIDTHIENINKTAPALAKSNPDIVKQVAATLNTPVTPETTTSKEIPVITTTKIVPLEVPTEVKKSLLTENGTETENEKVKENTIPKEDATITPTTESTLISSVGIIDKLQEEKEHLDSLTTQTPIQ